MRSPIVIAVPGAIIVLIFVGSSIAQDWDHPILGQIREETVLTFDSLTSYTVVQDFLFVEAASTDTLIGKYYRPRHYQLLNPFNHDTLWSRDGLWDCCPGGLPSFDNIPKSFV